MNLESLNVLLDILCVGNKMHICIHDISGLLEHPLLRLPFSYKIHACPFCDAAKETSAGLNYCMRNKSICNEKAVKYEKWFDGYCPNGIYEFVYPVKINGIVKCIIYIGNIIDDKNKVIELIDQTSNKTGIDSYKLKSKIDSAQPFISREHYLSIARLLDYYINLLSQSVDKSHLQEYHWVVKNICNDIETHYFGSITLKQEAQLYLFNEKYVGYLFKKELGCTFHEYLNQIRLQNSEIKLRETNHSILDIAIECGFQNVTYYNRLFKKKHGISPSIYRKSII